MSKQGCLGGGGDLEMDARLESHGLHLESIARLRESRKGGCRGRKGWATAARVRWRVMRLKWELYEMLGDRKCDVWSSWSELRGECDGITGTFRDKGVKESE